MGYDYRYFSNREFQKLAEQINKKLIVNEASIDDQQDQVERLYDLERKFKKSISEYKQAECAYEKFIVYIVRDCGNILNCYPYFRENEKTLKQISVAIKNGDAKALMKFDINYQLINFLVSKWEGELPKQVNKYFQELVSVRNILIENNLPLAINRAKLFYRKVPKSPHWTLLDFIGVCTYGLAIGIDKYTGPYSKVWRSVCIGRMVGFLIEGYSKTFLKMPPIDKKILYRANSLKYKLKIESLTDLTEAVNQSFYKEKKEGKKVPKLPIREAHLTALMHGTSYISADTKSTGTGNDKDTSGLNIYDYTPDSKDVEEEIIRRDIMQKIIIACHDLSVIERKVLKLKGVPL